MTEAQVISSYPLPPAHYIKAFTNDNVSKGFAPKPPSVAIIENYSMFGYDIESCMQNVLN